MVVVRIVGVIFILIGILILYFIPKNWRKEQRLDLAFKAIGGGVGFIGLGIMLLRVSRETFFSTGH